MTLAREYCLACGEGHTQPCHRHTPRTYESGQTNLVLHLSSVYVRTRALQGSLLGKKPPSERASEGAEGTEPGLLCEAHGDMTRGTE